MRDNLALRLRGKRNDRAFWIIAFLFLLLQLIEIKLPGITCEDGFRALGGWCFGDCNFVEIKIFGRTLPTLFTFMWADIHGNLSHYLMMPFLVVFGQSHLAVRFFLIFCAIIALILVYYSIKELFDRRVSILTIFLLIINVTFTAGVRYGNYHFFPQILCFSMGSLFCFLRYWKRHNGWYFYAGCLLLGLGTWLVAWFFWFLPPVILAGMTFHKEFRVKRIKLCVIGGVFFLLGASLLIAGIIWHDGTLGRFSMVKQIFSHFRMTYCGVDNLSYLNNLFFRTKTFLFSFLTGSSLMGSFLSSPTSFYRPNMLYPFLFMFSILWLGVKLFITKLAGFRKRILLLFILFIGTFLLTAFTLSNLEPAKLYILYPFPQVVISLAVCSILERPQKIKLLRKLIIMPFLIIFLFLIASDMILLRKYFEYESQTGGVLSFNDSTDAIYRLSDWLEENKITRPITLSTFLNGNFFFLTEGKVNPIYPGYLWGRQQPFNEEAALTEFRKFLSGSKDNIYLVSYPLPDCEEMAFSLFKQLIKENSMEIRVKQHFYRRDGLLVYTAFSVNKRAE